MSYIIFNILSPLLKYDRNLEKTRVCLFCSELKLRCFGDVTTPAARGGCGAQRAVVDVTFPHGDYKCINEALSFSETYSI